MNLIEKLIEKIHVYDGSKGSILMQMGLKGGEIPDMWNIERGGAVLDLYSGYIGAGADIIQTNTMQASRYHLEARGLYEKLREINTEGIRLAKRAVRESGRNVLVAASIGPLGGLMEPLGEMGLEDAVTAFAEQVEAVSDAGADILHFETFTDLAELRAALLAAGSISNLPMIATMSYGKNGKTIMGDDARLSALYLKAAGVSCIGANCSLNPFEMLPIIKIMSEVSVPICVKPNGSGNGLADTDSRTKELETFYTSSLEFAANGARLIGGCCGSNPEHIAMIRRAVDDYMKHEQHQEKCAFIECGQEKCEYAEYRKEKCDYTEYGQEKCAFTECGKEQVTESERKLLISHKQELILNDAELAVKNGLIDEIVLNSMDDEDDVISAMIEISGNPGKACVVTAYTGVAPRSRVKEKHLDTIGIEKLATLSKHTAINAKAYLNKPIIFDTDSPEVLKSGLRHYCGIAGVLFQAGCEGGAHSAVAKSKVLKSIAQKYGALCLGESITKI